MVPIVAIIGKPNVGKSSLFNLFIGYRKSIVAPFSGTTRDRQYAIINGNKPFLLADTGGIVSQQKNSLEENVFAQAKIAITESELILFLIDSKHSLTKEDYFIAQFIRKNNKKCILIATKCDAMRLDMSEYLKLGFGNPIPISTIHRFNIDQLKQEIFCTLPTEKKKYCNQQKKSIRIAILGRPNVGKSSLINSLLREERMIVHTQAGTTRDAVDIEMIWDSIPFILIDTAGIRRKGKIKNEIERYSFLRSLQAAEQADVCVLLIDAEEGITAQDLHVAAYIIENKRGLIIAVNKSDILPSDWKTKSYCIAQIRQKFRFIPWAPIIFISAKTGKNIENILHLAYEIFQKRKQRLNENLLQRWIKQIIFQPPTTDSIHIIQAGINPPHFVLFMKNKESFHFSSFRHLENKLREKFDFIGTPIQIDIRRKNVTS